MSYYVGPRYVGHPLSDPSRRRYLRAESSIVLNKAAAEHAFNLISAGCVSFAPFGAHWS
jgi:hypothetical protein